MAIEVYKPKIVFESIVLVLKLRVGVPPPSPPPSPLVPSPLPGTEHGNKNRKYTPLDHAIKQGHEEVKQILINAGAKRGEDLN